MKNREIKKEDSLHWPVIKIRMTKNARLLANNFFLQVLN